MRDRRVAAAIPKRLYGMSRRGDSHRALEGAGEIRGHRLRDLERRAEATDLGELDSRHVAGAELLRPACAEGGDEALVGGHANLDAAAHLDHLLEGADRLLGELDAVTRDGLELCGGVVDAPGAVRVHPDLNRIPERLP